MKVNNLLLFEDDFDFSTAIKNKNKNNQLQNQNNQNDFKNFIIGPNEENQNIIKDFIMRKETHTKVLYVSGDIGVGKSTIVKKNILDSNMYYEEYNQEFDENTTGSFLEDIFKIITRVDMSTFFGNSKKLVVIIKDFENSLKKSQRKNLFEFISKNELSVPLVLIASHKSKFSYKSYKFIKEIKINKLGIPLLLELADKTFNNNNQNQNQNNNQPRPSNESLLELAEKSNGDIRHFLDSLSMGSLRDYDLDIKNKFKEIIKKLTSCSDMCSIYTNSVVFANYTKWNGSSSNNMSEISEISEMFSYTDTINSNIFLNHMWDDYAMISSTNILSTIYPIYKTISNKQNISIDTIKDECIEDYNEELLKNENENDEEYTSVLKNENNIIENTTNSLYNASINKFKYLTDLNYALRYIVNISNYKEFIEDIFKSNIMNNKQLKIICEGLSKEKIKEFKKIYKQVLAEYEDYYELE